MLSVTVMVAEGRDFLLDDPVQLIRNGITKKNNDFFMMQSVNFKKCADLLCQGTPLISEYIKLQIFILIVKISDMIQGK